jgi:hypothetical protein
MYEYIQYRDLFYRTTQLQHRQISHETRYMFHCISQNTEIHFDMIVTDVNKLLFHNNGGHETPITTDYL